MPPHRNPSASTRAAPPLTSSKSSKSKVTGSNGRAKVRRARRSESLETQEKILNAAEALFLETGFAATSLRAITSRANVNLAAAHYHFGSKEGLLGAAFQRRIAPLNSIRLQALELLEARPKTPGVREVIGAFLEPLSSVDPQSPLPRLVGRLYSEPPSVSKPLIDGAFSEVSDRFLTALSRALPEIPLGLLRWRFHFVIGSMVHLITFEHPQIPLEHDAEMDDGLDQLIDFAVNGLDPEHASPREADSQPRAAFSTSRIVKDQEPKR
jgi:AcrR family transcriptional regulator